MRSVTGLRDTNQDRIEFIDTVLFGQPATIMALADGMGGLQDGEEAAAIAIETTKEFALNNLPQIASQAELRDELVELFQKTNRAILSCSHEKAGRGLGTTLVCCVIAINKFLVANVGDSRCYYVDGISATQLTKDHSAAVECDQPQLRHALTRSLGQEGRVNVDIFPSELNYGVLEDGCALVVCSDGLHAFVTDVEINEQCSATKDIRSACSNLISTAFMKGSTDNISVGIVEYGALSRTVSTRMLPDVEVLMRRRYRAQARRPMAAARRRALSGLVAAFGIVAAAFIAVLFLPPTLRSSGGGPAGAGRSDVEGPRRSAPQRFAPTASEASDSQQGRGLSPVPDGVTSRRGAMPPTQPVPKPGGGDTGSTESSNGAATPSSEQENSARAPVPSAGLEIAETRPSATPPALQLFVPPGTLTYEAASRTGAHVVYPTKATSDGREIATTCSPPSGSLFKLGKTTVTCAAADAGKAETKTFIIEIRDTTPPRIESIVLRPPSLPDAPKNDLVSVAVEIRAHDEADPRPVCRVASISSNRAPGEAAVETPHEDYVILPDALHVQLRNVAFQGADHIYSIHVECVDVTGNVQQGEKQLLVPQSRSSWLSRWLHR